MELWVSGLKFMGLQDYCFKVGSGLLLYRQFEYPYC